MSVKKESIDLFFREAPSSFVGERPARAIEVAAAKAALGRLDELGVERTAQAGQSEELEPRVLFDPRLVESKAVLRAYPPVRVRCPEGHHLDWIALAPLNDHGLQLVHGPRLQPPPGRQGGALDIQSGTLGGRSALGTITWIEDAQAGVGNVQPEPDGDHGPTWGAKIDYRCPKCSSSYTVLHVSLLRLFLDAVKHDAREVDLDLLNHGPTYARRIADRGTARAWSTRNARRRR